MARCTALAALCTLGAATQSLAGGGACCLPNPDGTYTCTIRSTQACFDSGGLFQGLNSTCLPTSPCPPPQTAGACCFLNAQGFDLCFQRTRANCFYSAGRYQGDNVACAATGHCPAKGGCCLTKGKCAVLERPDCESRRGTFLGAGAACLPNPCPQPIFGACCATAGIHAWCTIQNAASCHSINGTYNGDNSTCGPTTCPQPAIGSCCFAASPTQGAHCFIYYTSATCTAAGGTYLGDNSSCAAAPCLTRCPCDWDNNGRLNSADASAFLSDYLAGHGDFNHDGVTNGQDLTDFTACYLGPPGVCVPH